MHFGVYKPLTLCQRVFCSYKMYINERYDMTHEHCSLIIHECVGWCVQVLCHDSTCIVRGSGDGKEETPFIPPEIVVKWSHRKTAMKIKVTSSSLPPSLFPPLSVPSSPLSLSLLVCPGVPLIYACLCLFPVPYPQISHNS